MVRCDRCVKALSLGIATVGRMSWAPADPEISTSLLLHRPDGPYFAFALPRLSTENPVISSDVKQRPCPFDSVPIKTTGWER
jgi:hypothetical protein